MVPLAEAVEIVAPTAPDNATRKVSLDSRVESALTLMVMSTAATPAAKLTTTLRAKPPAKSLPFAALVPVPLTV